MDLNDILRAIAGARPARGQNNPLEDLLRANGYVRAGGGPDVVDIITFGGGNDPITEIIRTLAKRTKAPEDIISEVIDHHNAAGLQPKTERLRIDISDRIIFIGSEGMTEEFKHDHVNFLIRHPKETKKDRWRLYSICPNKAQVTPYLIRNCVSADDAVRKANVLFDIGLGIITQEDVNEFWKRAKDGDGKAGGSAAASAPGDGASGDR